jgi:hypothetical protein
LKQWKYSRKASLCQHWKFGRKNLDTYIRPNDIPKPSNIE